MKSQPSCQRAPLKNGNATAPVSGGACRRIRKYTADPATAIWTRIFVPARTPAGERLATFRKSSMKPSSPNANVTNSTAQTY